MQGAQAAPGLRGIGAQKRRPLSRAKGHGVTPAKAVCQHAVEGLPFGQICRASVGKFPVVVSVQVARFAAPQTVEHEPPDLLWRLDFGLDHETGRRCDPREAGRCERAQMVGENEFEVWSRSVWANEKY